LHSKAGSTDVIEVHGVLPTREELEYECFPEEYRGLVLYGDTAPKYHDAERLVKNLEFGNSAFVIVGTSFYTGISEWLHHVAAQRAADIYVINDSASVKVPELCEWLKREYV
jgi:hypothetical protein